MSIPGELETSGVRTDWCRHPARQQIEVLLLILLAQPAYAQDAWNDPSAHKTVFVTVEKKG